MKRSLYISGAFVLAAWTPFGLHAQHTQPKDTTVNRTVVVEQEYNPDILDAAKVNVLPQVEAPTVSKKPVEYATTLFPATSIPAGLMRAYTGKETQPETTPGYVRAGYGNYGNLDFLASYLFRLSAKDKLNVRLQMDGMDGELKKLSYAESERKNWDAYYYRTRANAEYTHQFDRLDFNMGGNFGLSNFNYYPESINNKQKFTSGEVRAGVKFTDETAPFRFNVETGLLMYERQRNLFKESDPGTAIKETILRMQGNVGGLISERQLINIGFEMNTFRYGGYTKDKATGNSYFHNYTALVLNPYYELNNDDWKLHLGANADFSFGFGKTYQLSPDVNIQYIFSDSYVLYAQAAGGKLVNDFRRLESTCPYGELPDAHITPTEGYAARPYDTYEQLNGSIGFKAGPYPGVWFHLYAGYQNLKDDLSYIPSATATNAGNRTYLNFAQGNTHNTYIGGEFNYGYKDIFSLSAAYTYRNWNTKGEERLLIVKPVGEMSFNVHARPIPALNLHIGYDYTDRKKVKEFPKMSPISDLHTGADYRIFKGVSAYARLHNLMNKKYLYYPGYAAEGLNFLGGLNFLF